VALHWQIGLICKTYTELLIHPRRLGLPIREFNEQTGCDRNAVSSRTRSKGKGKGSTAVCNKSSPLHELTFRAGSQCENGSDS